MDPLTPREYQVVMLVSRGLSNKEIARQLGISDGTVKLHVHKILKKLGERKRYGIVSLQSYYIREVLESGGSHSSRGRRKRRSKQVAV
jgi:DNA-binding NarL/FixJ family response regulator